MCFVAHAVGLSLLFPPESRTLRYVLVLSSVSVVLTTLESLVNTIQTSWSFYPHCVGSTLSLSFFVLNPINLIQRWSWALSGVWWWLLVNTSNIPGFRRKSHWRMYGLVLVLHLHVGLLSRVASGFYYAIYWAYHGLHLQKFETIETEHRFWCLSARDSQRAQTHAAHTYEKQS